MPPIEQTLEAAFQTFLAALQQANPEDQTRMIGQISSWMALLQSNTANSKESGTPIPHPDLGVQLSQSMRDGEVPLSQLADHMEQVIWIRDLRSGQIHYLSPAYELIWGRSRDSFSDHPLSWIETIHPEDRVQVMLSLQSHDLHPANQEYRILRPDGSIRWIMAHTFLLSGDAGLAACQVCIAQDITDRKNVELALRRALDRTQEQFALSRKMSLTRKPGVVLRALMSARELRSAKRAAMLFFGAPEDEPLQGIESIVTWQANQQMAAWDQENALYEEPTLWEVFQPNQPVQFPRIAQDGRLGIQVRNALMDGKIASLVIFPMHALGKWIGVLLVFYQDEHTFDPIELRHVKVLVDQATITLYNLQLLEVEADLRHEAERANEIKSQFLAMISHELRTPLTSIIGFTTTLLADDVTWEPDEQHDFIRTIQQEANRLQELIDHLLDLSRLEAGRLPIMPAPHSAQELIDNALHQLRSPSSDQKILVRVHPNVAPVLADAKRISQVVINLVQNALQYAPDGEITISAVPRKKYVQFSVADQGPGFPAAERKTAFEAFRRGPHEDDHSGKGAGLGLAICKRLIEAHGGRIWIKKQLAPGATICFTLPTVPQRTVNLVLEKER